MLMLSHLCFCGCGGTPRKNNRYIYGHQNTGRHKSKEIIAKIKFANTGRQKGKDTKFRSFWKFVEWEANPYCICGCKQIVRIGENCIRGHFSRIHNPMSGKKFTEEHLKKLSEKHKGLKASIETKKKMSLKQTGKKVIFTKEGLQSQIDSHSSEKFKETCRNIHKNRSVEEKQRRRELCVKNLQKKFVKSSIIENKFKQVLIEKNISFLQNPIIIISKYEFCQPDFLIQKINLIILVDGCYWHGCPIHFKGFNPNQKYDERNMKFYLEKGYKVFRFWEHEINESVEKCVDKFLGVSKI